MASRSPGGGEPVTIANNTPYKTVNGPQTATWTTSITWDFWDSTDIKVVKVVSGVESIAVEGVDYSITGGSGSTGTFSGLINIAGGDKWFIYRELPRSQGFNYLNQDTFQSESHEEALDRLVAEVQEIRAELERNIRIPISDDRTLDLELPDAANRASLGLTFDASGNVIAGEILSAGDLTVSVYIRDNILNQASKTSTQAELDIVKQIENTVAAKSWDGCGAGTLAQRPAAATFGQGVYYANDTQKLYYSSGATWAEITIQEAIQSSLGTDSGELGLATDRNYALHRGNGAGASILIRPYPPNFKSGGELVPSSAGAAAADQQVQINVGKWRNTLPAASADQVNIDLGAAITKTFAAGNWVAGDGQSGLAAGAIAANTWYHVFVLYNPTTGVTDAGFDTLANGSNLLGLAAVIAAGLTRAVCVGSVYVGDASLMIPFRQQRDTFWWNHNVVALEADNGADSSGSQNWVTGYTHTLRYVPPGFRIEIVTGHAQLENASWGAPPNDNLDIFSPDDAATYTTVGNEPVGPDIAAGPPVSPQIKTGRVVVTNTSNLNRHIVPLNGLRTNTSAQLRGLTQQETTGILHFIIKSFRHPKAATDVNE